MIPNISNIYYIKNLNTTSGLLFTFFLLLFDLFACRLLLFDMLPFWLLVVIFYLDLFGLIGGELGLGLRLWLECTGISIEALAIQICLFFELLQLFVSRHDC